MITNLFELLETGTFDTGGVWSSGACGASTVSPITFDPNTGVLDTTNYTPPSVITPYVFSYTVNCGNQSSCTEVTLYLGDESVSCPDPTIAGGALQVVYFDVNGALNMFMQIEPLNLNVTIAEVYQVVVTETATNAVLYNAANFNSTTLFAIGKENNTDPSLSADPTIQVDVYVKMGDSCVCCHLTTTIPNAASNLNTPFALTKSPLLVCPVQVIVEVIDEA